MFHLLQKYQFFIVIEKIKFSLLFIEKYQFWANIFLRVLKPSTFQFLYLNLMADIIFSNFFYYWL